MAEQSFRFKTPATAEEAAAIVARLTAAMKLPGEPFNPYGHMDLSPSATEQLARVRFGMLAMDFFAGRLKEDARREAGRGLAQAIHQQMGTGEIYAYSISNSDIAETAGSFWEVVDRILRWLKQLGGIGGSSVTFPADVVVAAAICLYYYKNRPTPPCPVTEVDKWRHCYVGCKLGFWVPNGLTWGYVAALLKELLDAAGMGTPEFEDFVESVRGVVACGFFQSCEECCCEKGY